MQRQLTTLEHKLDSVLEALAAREASDWIDRKTACTLLGITDRHLFNLIAEGTVHGDAVRNVGSVKKPRYRFHRSMLLNQYLNRA